MVSILVFLESALKQCIKGGRLFNSIRFQSLFSWNLPSNQYGAERLMQARLVSILVFLESALKPAWRTLNRLSWIKFQSLFSWNLPSNNERQEKRHRPRPISILVFLESALKPEFSFLFFPQMQPIEIEPFLLQNV